MEKGVWGHRPVLEGGREGGGGGGPAIPILNRKFSHCRIFPPLMQTEILLSPPRVQTTNIAVI